MASPVICWILKNDPLRSNSSLIRATWTSRWLSNQGYESQCIAPAAGMHITDWHSHGAAAAIRSMARCDVIIIQKIWQPELLVEAQQRARFVIFDADDEFDPGTVRHRHTVEAARLTVCSSIASKRDLLESGIATVHIPCHVESPQCRAAHPTNTPIAVWTGYKDTNLIELTAIEEALKRLWREHSCGLIVHGSGVSRLPWSSGVVDLPFSLPLKESVLCSGSIGISCKPTTGSWAKKTEDKLTTYMAHGLVPFVTPIESYRSVVDDGVNGVLLPFADDDAWYDAMAAVLTDCRKWRQMSDAAIRTVQERYSSHAISSAWLGAIRTVLDGLALAPVNERPARRGSTHASGNH